MIMVGSLVSRLHPAYCRLQGASCTASGEKLGTRRLWTVWKFAADVVKPPNCVN